MSLSILWVKLTQSKAGSRPLSLIIITQRQRDSSNMVNIQCQNRLHSKWHLWKWNKKAFPRKNYSQCRFCLTTNYALTQKLSLLLGAPENFSVTMRFKKANWGRALAVGLQVILDVNDSGSWQHLLETAISFLAFLSEKWNNTHSMPRGKWVYSCVMTWSWIPPVRVEWIKLGKNCVRVKWALFSTGKNKQVIAGICMSSPHSLCALLFSSLCEFQIFPHLHTRPF